MIVDIGVSQKFQKLAVTGTVLLTAALLLSASHKAQAADVIDVYAAAKENDPVIGAARAGFKATRQAVPQARSTLLPQVTVGGTTSDNKRSFPIGPQLDTNPQSPSFGQFIDIPAQEFNERVGQAELSQTLFDYSSWQNLKAAKHTVGQARHQLAADEQLLIVRAIEAYLNVLRAQDLLESTQAEEAAVKRQLEQVQQRFDVGLVAITDVLESQAAYDAALVRRIQADGDHDIFFETLRTLTVTDFDSLDRLSEQLPIIDPEPRSEAQWVASALDTNLNIKAAQSALKASERNLKSRRGGHLPTVSANARYLRFRTGGPAFLGGRTDQTTYELAVNVPVFLGGLNFSRTAEANALVQQSRQLLENQKLVVTRDTRNLFRVVATEVLRVKARRKAIESAESALEATETGYDVGTRNIVDVLLAQQRLYASQFEYADSRYNYVLNLMRLKQATGNLSEQDLAELNQFADNTNPVNRLPPSRDRGADLSP